MNTSAVYESSGTTSHGTISDVKSHKVLATWASLAQIFNTTKFENVETLYICYDSPISQYRNKFNVYPSKYSAVQNSL